MHCDSVIEHLDLMVDDQTSTNSTVDVFKHLEACFSCHSVWLGHHSIKSRVRDVLNRIHASSALRQRIKAQLISEATRSTSPVVARENGSVRSAVLGHNPEDVFGFFNELAD